MYRLFTAFFVTIVFWGKNVGFLFVNTLCLAATFALKLNTPSKRRINVIYFGMDVVPAVLFSYVYCDLILLGLLVYDLLKRKPYRPYLYALVFLLICHTSLLCAPFTPVWVAVATTFAQTFF